MKSKGIPTRVDTMCLLPEQRRFFLVHRAGFTYRFVEEEKREARLREKALDRKGEGR